MIADFANFCTFEPGNLKQDERDFQDCQDEAFLVKREPVPSSVGYLNQDEQDERDFQDCQSMHVGTVSNRAYQLFSCCLLRARDRPPHKVD